MLPFGRKNPDTAGAGAANVALCIYLHAVRQAVFLLCAHVEEDPSFAQRSIGGNFVSHPESLLWIRIRHIQGLLVRGKCQAVGSTEVLVQELKLSVGSQTVDALEIQFFFLLVKQSVRRIGKVQGAVGLIYGVVRAVQPLALILVSQDR